MERYKLPEAALKARYPQISGFFYVSCYTGQVCLLMVFNKICTPNKTSRNFKLFYERKGKFYSCNRYENLSPLNNSINFIIVNCLQHVL